MSGSEDLKDRNSERVEELAPLPLELIQAPWLRNEPSKADDYNEYDVSLEQFLSDRNTFFAEWEKIETDD